MSEWPYISVVMPVKNEERFIQSTLRQVLAQDYPPDRYEVIVVDGGSTDETREKVRELARLHPRVRLVENPRGYSSSGRNIGFRRGKGSIFIVIDGHSHIENERLFQSIVRCFETSGADCLGRPQPLDPPGIGAFQKSVALARASFLGHHGASFIYSEREGFVSPQSVGAVYRREVFEKIGYVDEAFDACEDVEFNYRVEKAGLRCYIHPSLRIRYYPRDSFTGLFNQMARYGEGRLNLLWKHPRTLSLTLLVPAAFVLGVILYYLSFIFLPRYFILMALPFALYTALLALEGARAAWKHGPIRLLHVPACLFVIHFSLGWGFLRGLLKKLVPHRRLKRLLNLKVTPR